MLQTALDDPKSDRIDAPILLLDHYVPKLPSIALVGGCPLSEELALILAIAVLSQVALAPTSGLGEAKASERSKEHTARPVY